MVLRPVQLPLIYAKLVRQAHILLAGHQNVQLVRQDHILLPVQAVAQDVMPARMLLPVVPHVTPVRQDIVVQNLVWLLSVVRQFM